MTDDQLGDLAETDRSLDPVRVASTFVHGFHLAQRVTKRDGNLRARGKYHLAQHGPTTLCGTTLDLPRTERRDLYTSELVHPEHGVDVCAECVEALGQLRPDLGIESAPPQRLIVEGQA